MICRICGQPRVGEHECEGLREIKALRAALGTIVGPIHAPNALASLKLVQWIARRALNYSESEAHVQEVQKSREEWDSDSAPTPESKLREFVEYVSTSQEIPGHPGEPTELAWKAMELLHNLYAPKVP